MIKVLIIIIFIIFMVIGVKLHPEFEGAIISLGITVLSGAGIITKEMYLKIIINDKKLILILNWIFFILGILLTTLFLTVWKGPLD